MIPKKIQALFDLIDYLNDNKDEYIEKYIPLCNELLILDNQREELKPNSNYIDKQKYNKIQAEISEKFSPITLNIYQPITEKLRELEIWNGDDTFNSIWNSNSSEIYDFKNNFKSVDIPQVMEYKQKYLSFRNETNTDFLCLHFVFTSLDELLKELFDFFKDTIGNEFLNFESKTIKVNSIEEAVLGFAENKGKNIKFTIPTGTIYNSKNDKPIRPSSTSVKNEFIMGDKINVGDIPNNNGQINIGRKNTNESNINDSSEDLAKKSFNWQKWGVIIAAILGIVTILVTILT